MAPYISSHLSGKVWKAPHLPGAQLDILQNLVANTRTPRSASARSCQPSDCLPGGGLRPAAWKTSAWKWQRVEVDSGWSREDTCAGRVVAQATALLDRKNFW